MIKLITLLSLAFSFSSMAQIQIPADGRIDIWPAIPFVRGADLCRYRDHYSQTRTKYIQDMVYNAESLLQSGAIGAEAMDMLMAFNDMYDRNQQLALQHNYLDVTLESTFKAFMDGYYRTINPKVKKISFRHVNDLLNVVRSARNGQRDGYLDHKLLAKLDFIAYGTYTLAPNCNGDIQITLHFIGRDGVSESFEGTGHPSTVMSQIASEVFTKYQRTTFPSQVRIGTKMLTLVGGLNGSVDVVTNPRIAEEACQTLDARLPTEKELDLLNSYGDWSGGVSINDKVWAMSNGYVYHPGLRNPTPVRHYTSVNDRSFLYYCVK